VALPAAQGCWADNRRRKYCSPNPRGASRNVAGGLRQRDGAQKLLETSLLSRLAVQRLSPENRGILSFRAGYRNGGGV
jgi:hypothetical protein